MKSKIISISSKSNTEQIKLIFLITILFIAIFLNNYSAYSQSPVETKSFINSKKGSMLSQDKKESEKISKLIYDLQPTFYVRDNKITKKDNGFAIRGEINLNDVPFLYTKNDIFESVEMITIRIITKDKISHKINLSNLTQFKSLKYIHFVINFSCDSSYIESLYEGENDKCKILYTIEIPE